jgi:hypothetical protein
MKVLSLGAEFFRGDRCVDMKKLIVAFRHVANGDNGVAVTYSVGTDSSVRSLGFQISFHEIFKYSGM